MMSMPDTKFRENGVFGKLPRPPHQPEELTETRLCGRFPESYFEEAGVPSCWECRSIDMVR
jgi:hypothetical protein